MNKSSNWNQTMEEEEESANLSSIAQQLNRKSDNNEQTDGTENIDDRMINRMIQENISLRGGEDRREKAIQTEERVNLSFPGVSLLATASTNKLSQDDLTSMIQQTISLAVKEAIKPLMNEIGELRRQITDHLASTLQDQNIIPTPVWPRIRDQGAIPKVVKVDSSENSKAHNLANRCVGLGPISEDIVLQHVQDTNPTLDKYTRHQIGGAFAARDFLCKEMGMSDPEAENVRILRTFRVKEHDDNLFVEFGDESHLRKIRSKVSNLSNGKEDDPRLTTYVPKHLQPQYSRLVTRANRGRAQTPRQSSKI